jgi:hypothetical protein
MRGWPTTRKPYNYNWNSVYAKEFPVLADGLNVVVLRTMSFLVGEEYFGWMDVCGLNPEWFGLG